MKSFTKVNDILISEFKFDIVATPFPVMAGQNSLCDLSSENCSTFSVFGQDFQASPSLSCRVRAISLEERDPRNWKYLSERETVGAEYVDQTRVRCSVPQSVLWEMERSVDSLTVEVELSNTGTVWSSGIFLTIFNSSCQSCSHQPSPLLPTICRQREDVCRSD